MVIPGEITEIVGRRSSGRTSALLACLAGVTRAGGIAALIDSEDALDVESAAHAGVELKRLLWVRCGRVRRQAALRAVDMLARCQGFAVVAWDVGDTPPRLSLALAFRLRLAARQGGAALLIVNVFGALHNPLYFPEFQVAIWAAAGLVVGLRAGVTSDR